MNRHVAVWALLLVLGVNAATAQDLQFAELGECPLVSGEIIQDCRIGYRILGTLNEDGTNVVLFPSWAGGTSEELLSFVGPEGMVDPATDYVIMVDAFANGVSSSPSNSPRQPGADFPHVTLRDMVRQQHRMLLESLHIGRLKAVIGISMGGMQAFEWAASFPGFAQAIVPVVGSPRPDPYDVVMWETQLRTLRWYLECRCQEAASASRGLSFLMLGPDFHAGTSPRDSLAAVRQEIGAATLESDATYDRIAQIEAMLDLDITNLSDGSLEEAAHRTDADFFIVVGLKDHIVTPGPAIEFARLLGAPTLESDGDCGHLISWCETGPINTAVRSFLAGVAPHE